jgi:hypothetical protein
MSWRLRSEEIAHGAPGGTGATALSFGLEAEGKQARSETGAAPNEAAQPAPGETRPIPEAGQLAQPKLLDQVGLPGRAASPGDLT